MQDLKVEKLLRSKNPGTKAELLNQISLLTLTRLIAKLTQMKKSAQIALSSRLIKAYTSQIVETSVATFRVKHCLQLYLKIDTSVFKSMQQFLNKVDRSGRFFC